MFGWLVVAALCAQIAINSTLFMDLSSLQEASQKSFGVSALAISLSYSIPLITASVLMPIMSWLIVVNEVAAFAILLFGNVSACWMRWYGVHNGLFQYVIGSSFLAGLAASVIIVSYSAIPERWLPASTRLWGTSITCLSCYLGWLLGCCIPFVAKDLESLEPLLLIRFWMTAASCPSILLILPPNRSLTGVEFHAEQRSLQDLTEMPSLTFSHVARCVCYAVLNGTAFAIPGVMGPVLHRCCSLSAETAGISNIIYIGMGILSTLCVGMISNFLSPDRLLKYLFTLATLSTASMALITVSWPSHGLQSPQREFMFLVSLALSGTAGLGFIAIGFQDASIPTISGAYTSGVIEWAVQHVAAIVTNVSLGPWGFTICATITFLVTVLLVATSPNTMKAETKAFADK